MPQKPTCTNIRIRSVRDAHAILFACYKGLLPLIKSRLDTDDRNALASGNVYAWEERGSRSESSGVGIERFTEGKRWSASRLREDFLYYHEKCLPSENFHRITHPPVLDPFVKQTYSAWVATTKGDRKWHLTAYYTDRTREKLQTIDDNPVLRDLVIPEGHFRSNAVVKTKKPDDRPSFDIPSISRVYAPFPSSRAPAYIGSYAAESRKGGVFVTIPPPMALPETRDVHCPDFMNASHMTATTRTDAIMSGSFYIATQYQRMRNMSYPRLAVQPASSTTPMPDRFDGPSSGRSMDMPSDSESSAVNEFEHTTVYQPPSAAAAGNPRSYSPTSSGGPVQNLDDKRRHLVPLATVLQARAYCRDPLDDRALRLLDSYR